MTSEEIEIERHFGIETAAAYRSAIKNIENGVTWAYVKKYAVNWENACRKLLGEKEYIRTRRLRYSGIINEMEKEKDADRVDYLDEQSLMTAFKKMEAEDAVSEA